MCLAPSIVRIEDDIIIMFSPLEIQPTLQTQILISIPYPQPLHFQQ